MSARLIAWSTTVALLASIYALLAGALTQRSLGQWRQVGPRSSSPLPTTAVLIDALYYDAYELGEPDEAVCLMNVSQVAVDIGQWRLTDGETMVTFPAGTRLAPGEAIWCTQEATAFARQFGFKPDFESRETDASVQQLAGSWPRFANTGDECLLYDRTGNLVDSLVYEGGDTSLQGWSGPAVTPWTPSPTFAAEGQILYRKRQQSTGKPVPDTGSAVDWAQDPEDHIDGRKVRYPGWDLDPFFFTERITETAMLTVSIAPDNLFETLSTLLAGAQDSIEIQSYSFRSREIAAILQERLAAGVRVRLLLEGGPAFGGLTDQEKWIARQLHSGGAQVLFMVNDETDRIRDRYKNQHAKVIVVDAEKALVGSENPSFPSMPADDKSNGTAGRRGVYLITDAPGVVGRVEAILDADADAAHHVDLADCGQMPDLCTPPAGFEPEMTPDWITYPVQFPMPATWQGSFAFEVLNSPENSLRTEDGLLGLLDRAGAGDLVLIQQLNEPTHWGPSSGTPASDPNPRLAAYLAAARRGATVRILLDGYLDAGGENATTVGYLEAMGRAEDLDLRARLANPASLGLHNKMILAQIDGRGYVHIGSLNGNEASSKINRELALQVQCDEAFNYLRRVFDHDWQSATPPLFLPLVVKAKQTVLPAGHLLVSEVAYGSIPQNEWVEIYNPTGLAINLSHHKVSDAAHADDYEGTHQFPAGTMIQPDEVLVVAVTATGFQQDWIGQSPDFEILDTDPAVPDMVHYSRWGRGDWGLRNGGDEVLLLDSQDQPVDIVVYGQGDYPGIVPHPGVAYGHSLERMPPWRDTDNCAADFRDWPYPSPGRLP